jgi:hypothetical protein
MSSEREEIMDMIRNEYDPAPSHYRMGDDWDDGAGRIADAILADKLLLLRKHADEIDQLRKAGGVTSGAATTWECMGRKQSLPEPGECNWPGCGCDPHATKVIESLLEQGWGPRPLAQTENEPGK